MFVCFSSVVFEELRRIGNAINMTDPSSSALVRVESTDTGGERGREYRKGIWTLEETMILLEAKKQDDERRMRGGDKERGKTAELRWKWVENYCFKHGCIRSQNQCNDKWDNLLRDYKKVREYENRLSPGQPSYWHLEKHERKERGLPSNLLYQVYEALHEVVDKRYAPRITHTHSGEKPSTSLQQHEQQQQHTFQPNLPQQQQQLQQPLPTHQQIPTTHHQQQQQQPVSGGCSVEMSDSSESEGTELPHSPAKRRRVWRSTHGLAPAMSKCTEELAQTLMACEEKKDKRHKDILVVEQKKLNIEESKLQISRDGIEGLINAVNNLANAIRTLASEETVTAD